MPSPRSPFGLALAFSLCAGLFLAGDAGGQTPVETDTRLHADGKGWRIDKAKITDPKRPRVLLVGDSILNGYLKSTLAALDGKAYVDAWVNPYNQSEHLNKTILPEVLANGPYDVIHFNMGLHGWQEGRIKPGTFEPLTKGYVEVIRAKLPNAKIIWASSTPVTKKGVPTEFEPNINPIIIEHNRLAAKVMAELKVPVNDFYGLLADKLKLARGDMFHWTPPAYQLLSEMCVASVRRELGIVEEKRPAGDKGPLGEPGAPVSTSPASNKPAQGNAAQADVPPATNTATDTTAAPPVPHWLAGPDTVTGAFALTRDLRLDKSVQQARIRWAGDFCRTVLMLNGRVLQITAPFTATQELDVTAHCVNGSNELRLMVDRACGPAAVALSFDVRFVDRSVRHLVSDASWKREATVSNTGVPGSPSPATAHPANSLAPPAAAVDLGPVRPELWGIGRASIAVSPFENYEQWRQSLGGVTPEATRLQAASGFEARLIRAASPEEGSWVSMAFDAQGRLTIAREDKGFLRFSLEPMSHAVTRTEVIPSDLAECRGLQYIEGILVAHANNSKGLYRLRITEAGQCADVALVREFAGGVGHGRNDVALGPDGKLYFIHGDSVETPASQIVDHTSLLRESKRNPPQPQKDGFVLRTDRTGRAWELLCGGLRNPYGIAVHPNGDLFTYDADNEYDMGMPWYRPTRIVQLTSGSDYGYRNATGIIPGRIADQPDFAPATLDIGRGSPTAALFGTSLKFPAAYRDALYVLDWSYGRVLAIHLAGRGAGYRAAAELFAQGRPLNVTDLAAGPDGAMYLITGGRKTQSALYRIAYTGPQANATASSPSGLPASPVTTPTTPSGDSEHERRAAAFTLERRRLRLQLETFHVQPNAAAINAAWGLLADPDPLLRSAARAALEKTPAALWRDRALTEPVSPRGLAALLSLARAHDPQLVPRLLDRLRAYSLRQLELDEQLTWLRILSLCEAAAPDVVRTQSSSLRPLLVTSLVPLRAASRSVASPKAGVVAPVVAPPVPGAAPVVNASPTTSPLRAVSPLGTSDDVRRRLLFALGQLRAPELVSFCIEHMLDSPVQEDRLTALVVLRNVPSGWTLEHRRRYFQALRDSSDMLGGQGLPVVRDKIRTEAMSALTPDEQRGLADVLAEKKLEDEPLPATREIVRKWTLDDLAPLHQAGATSGSAERGQEVFKLALCIRCHQSGRRGTAVGPELTQVSRRFSRRDMLESILSPSLSVAENFRNAVVETKQGKTHTGRIVSEGDFRAQTLKLSTDPLRPSQIVEIDKRDILEFQLSHTSPMPQGLLDSFTLEEIRDLLTFLESTTGP